MSGLLCKLTHVIYAPFYIVSNLLEAPFVILYLPYFAIFTYFKSRGNSADTISGPF